MRAILIFLTIFTSQLIFAQTIAYTSFEEPTNVGGLYTDTGDPAVDHPLVNNPGEPDVNYTSTGGEIGFSSYYYNTRNDVGLTDGDYVGVTNYTGTVGSYPDGSNGFEFSDTDGKMTVTFDAVSLTGASSPQISVQYFVQSTGYESDDVIRIWVVVDGGTELDLLNTTGSDIDDLNIEGAWKTLTQDLTGYTTATLKVEMDCNSGSEALYIDNIMFVDNVNTQVQFASETATVNEGDGTYDLIVSISNPDANNATTADVVLISGDPADLGNYTTQTVTFPAGSSDNQIVTVTITDDSDIEGDEDFTFQLQNFSGGNNASAGTPSQFVLTVTDNDFAAVPNIVINEIMQNPSAVVDDVGEWFELYNNDTETVDINGWIIKDDDTDYHVIDNGGPLTIAPGAYLVLGVNGNVAENGGVNVDYVYSGFTLANSDDEVVLVYSDGITEVDRVEYDNGATFPDPNGASMELRNPNYDNNDGSNWDAATTPYGNGDLGTPGAKNDNYVSALEPAKSMNIKTFQILPNYPNPFNPQTQFKVEVPEAVDQLRIEIFNTAGQLVKTIYQGRLSPGQHTFKWKGVDEAGKNSPSGVYFAVLKTQNLQKSIKMILLR